MEWKFFLIYLNYLSLYFVSLCSVIQYLVAENYQQFLYKEFPHLSNVIVWVSIWAQSKIINSSNNYIFCCCFVYFCPFMLILTVLCRQNHFMSLWLLWKIGDDGVWMWSRWPSAGHAKGQLYIQYNVQVSDFLCKIYHIR